MVEGLSFSHMLFRRLVLNSFAKLKNGRLEVRLPDGTDCVYGTGGEGPRASIHITKEEFFKRCVFYGPIGFAEGYIAGEWETDDLTKLIAWFILNASDAEALQTQTSRGTGLFDLFSAFNRLFHRMRHNSRAMSEKNIREHYDLSNDFFRLWLDPTMTYSSAYFEKADESLEAAQIRKYDKLCRRLHLAPTDSVLEIGSGTGQHATTAGCLAMLTHMKARGVVVRNCADIGTGTGVLAAVLAAALAYALYIPILGSLQRQREAIDVSRAIAVGGAVLFVGWAVVTGTLFRIPDGVAFGASALQGVLSAVSFLAFLAGLRVLGPVRTAITSTVEPFWTTMLGLVLLRQSVGTGTLIGGVAIMGAVLLLQRPAGAHRPAHSSAADP